jgi:hypothetical protein
VPVSRVMKRFDVTRIVHSTPRRATKAGACRRHVGRCARRAGARQAPVTTHRCSPSRKGSSLTRSTEPWPSPGPRQERPVRWQVSWLTGRSEMHGPSRTNAMAAWISSGCSLERSVVHHTRRLQLQGQLRIWGFPRTAFPFKPQGAPARSLPTDTRSASNRRLEQNVRDANCPYFRRAG